MEEAFKYKLYPSPVERQRLAAEHSMSVDQVNIRKEMHLKGVHFCMCKGSMTVYDSVMKRVIFFLDSFFSGNINTTHRFVSGSSTVVISGEAS